MYPAPPVTHTTVPLTFFSPSPAIPPNALFLSPWWPSAESLSVRQAAGCGAHAPPFK
jgi:hypothetical protein